MNIYYDMCKFPYAHSRLVFPVSWIGTKLPPAPKNRDDYDKVEYPQTAFEIELLDTQDGKIYKGYSWAHYEDAWTYGNTETTVHIYMFLEHYCACHRKIDALDAGADTDEECEGERFLVRSITAPAHLPGLILYSETLTLDELNISLERFLATTECPV